MAWQKKKRIVRAAKKEVQEGRPARAPFLLLPSCFVPCFAVAFLMLIPLGFPRWSTPEVLHGLHGQSDCKLSPLFLCLGPCLKRLFFTERRDAQTGAQGGAQRRNIAHKARRKYASKSSKLLSWAPIGTHVTRFLRTGQYFCMRKNAPTVRPVTTNKENQAKGSPESSSACTPDQGIEIARADV